MKEQNENFIKTLRTSSAIKNNSKKKDSRKNLKASTLILANFEDITAAYKKLVVRSLVANYEKGNFDECVNDLKKIFLNNCNANNNKTQRISNGMYDFLYSVLLLKFKNINIFLNQAKIFIDKLNEGSLSDIEFDLNSLFVFKKIIVKTIKKLFLNKSKESFENFDFILNINNYTKYFSSSKKSLIIFTLIIYVLYIITFHDSKSDTIQSLLNNYINEILKLICDGNIFNSKMDTEEKITITHETQEANYNINNNVNTHSEALSPKTDMCELCNLLISKNIIFHLRKIISTQISPSSKSPHTNSLLKLKNLSNNTSSHNLSKNSPNYTPGISINNNNNQKKPKTSEAKKANNSNILFRKIEFNKELNDLNHIISNNKKPDNINCIDLDLENTKKSKTLNYSNNPSHASTIMKNNFLTNNDVANNGNNKPENLQKLKNTQICSKSRNNFIKIQESISLTTAEKMNKIRRMKIDQTGSVQNTVHSNNPNNNIPNHNPEKSNFQKFITITKNIKESPKYKKKDLTDINYNNVSNNNSTNVNVEIHNKNILLNYPEIEKEKETLNKISISLLSNNKSEVASKNLSPTSISNNNINLNKEPSNSNIKNICCNNKLGNMKSLKFDNNPNNNFNSDKEETKEATVSFKNDNSSCNNINQSSINNLNINISSNNNNNIMINNIDNNSTNNIIGNNTSTSQNQDFGSKYNLKLKTYLKNAIPDSKKSCYEYTSSNNSVNNLNNLNPQHIHGNNNIMNNIISNDKTTIKTNLNKFKLSAVSIKTTNKNNNTYNYNKNANTNNNNVNSQINNNNNLNKNKSTHMNMNSSNYSNFKNLNFSNHSNNKKNFATSNNTSSIKMENANYNNNIKGTSDSSCFLLSSILNSSKNKNSSTFFDESKIPTQSNVSYSFKSELVKTKPVVSSNFIDKTGSKKIDYILSENVKNINTQLNCLDSILKEFEKETNEVKNILLNKKLESQYH